MKFGLRIPSLKKRVSARISPKRYVRHNLGLKVPKGFGFFTNPKKAIYNRIYQRTTFGINGKGGSLFFGGLGLLGIVALGLMIAAPVIIPVVAIGALIIYLMKKGTVEQIPPEEITFTNGLEAYQAGRTDEALENFLAVKDAEPCAALFAVGIMGGRDDRAGEAVALLEALVAQQPVLPSRLMEKYEIHGNTHIDVMPGLRVHIPFSPAGTRVLLGALYCAAGRLEESKVILYKVLQSPAHVHAVTAVLCRTLVALEEWQPVLALTDGVSDVDNESLGVACYRAHALVALHKFVEAKQLLVPMLRKKKERAPELRCEGYYWRAQAYLGMGKKAAAVRDLERIEGMVSSFRDVHALLK